MTLRAGPSSAEVLTHPSDLRASSTSGPPVLDAREAPGPRPRGLAGNLSAYEADRLGFLLRTRSSFGDYVAFDSRTLIVHAPDGVRSILQDRGHDFLVKQNFLLERLTEQEAFAAVDRSLWLRPGLRRSAVADHRHTIACVVDETLRERRRGGHDVDSLRLLETITSQAMARICFGSDAGGIATRTGELLDALSRVIGNPLAVPGWAWLPSRRRIASRHALLRELVEPLVAERVRRPDDFDDLATQIVWAHGRTTGGAADVAAVSHVLIGALLAGHRVPAAAAAWTLMLLADHPEVQDLVHAEVAVEDGNRPAEGGHDTGGMVRAAIMESLRLYPPTWMITRQAVRETAVGPVRVPAGHHLIVSPYVLHRDEREYPHADEYLPQRWLGPGGQRAAFIPFGLGRNACPGGHLTMLLLSEVVRATVRGCVVRRSGEAVTPDPRTTLLPSGLRLVLADR